MRHVPDPYRALGLSRGATVAEIKAAHRALAKLYHPDSAGGDTDRFLMVQEAYKLLVDPLRRREWDARHAPGPVRAGEAARARPRASNGRWTRAEETSGPSADAGTRADPMSGRGRDPGSRTYTWSASEVPWWEEGSSRNARRPGGRKRPRQGAAGADDTGSGRATAEAAPDFDVYNRSSGAAWSMAARAYFRRGDTDLPRHGSFHRQGTQPLTAARARAAQEEEARRAHASAPPRPQTAAAQAAQGPGVVRDASRINQVRAAARRRELATRWPSLGQRLLYALVAWAPIAMLIGYGGAWATGCDRASVACPPELATIQTIAIALVLGVLVALPRLSYALALATAAVLVGGLAVVLITFVVGLRPPLPPSVLILSTALLVIVHVCVAAWVLMRGRRRPWVVPQRINRGRAR